MPRIPYGTKYTMPVSGVTWKPVTCENCGCVYYYQIKHQTSGSADNVLWLNKQGAIDKAEYSANQNLEKYLKNAVRNYSCPDCGFYQTEMIRRMKNNIWLRAALFGVIAFVFIFANATSSSSSLFYALVAGLVVSGILLIPLARFDPNSNAQARENQKFSDNYPVLRKSEIEQLSRSKS
jgi:hypothetical protein